MAENLFWLTEAQVERLRPLLPDKVRGVPRADDRKVISGIVHVLKSGCRWADAPPEYGPKKTLYNRFVRWSEKGHWVRIFEALADEGGLPSQVMIDSSAVRAHRSAAGGKRGDRSHAIGRSRGGRTTKVQAACNRWCRPVPLTLTGGQVPNCVAAKDLIAKPLPGSGRFIMSLESVRKLTLIVPAV